MTDEPALTGRADQTPETGQDRETDPHQETEPITNRQEKGTTIDHQETRTTSLDLYLQ